MKKNIKYFWAIILSFIIVLGVGAMSKDSDSFAAEYNGFKYFVSSGKATITGYTGDELDVVIPSSINGYPVTKIGNNAFGENNTNNYIKSVKIPNSVTYIDDYAFMCNYNLESVEMTDSVTYIGLHCFELCENLKSVNLSKNLTDLNSYLFNGCISLESIEIPNKVTEIGKATFCSCENIKNIEVPSSVIEIASEAFADCYNLESINIPSSITGINYGLFWNCRSLKSIEIPESVTYISTFAFANCSNLESIEIPDSVTEIGENILKDCYNLNKIYVYKDSYAYNYLVDDYEDIIVLMEKESTLGITGENYPTIISEGSPFTLTGKISSNYKITYVRVQVLNSLGEAVSTASKTVYPDEYRYSNIDSGIKFGTLSAGNYTYQVIAKDESGTQKTLVNKGFTVKEVSVIKTGLTTDTLNVRKGPSTSYSILGKLSEGTRVQIVEIDSSTGWYKIKYGSGYGYVSYKYINIDGEEVVSILGITGENYPTTIVQGNSFKLTGKISSNYKITNVKVQVLDQNENAVSTASKSVYPNEYTYSNIDSGIKFGTLSVGNYAYQVIASDESGVTKILVNKNFEVVKPTVSVSNVTNLKYTSTTSTETLSWSKVNQASGYEIWMYKSSLGSYTKIKTITSGSTTSYKRSSLTSSTMYRYKIRAYRTVNGVKYYGDFTDEFITGTKPLTPSITLSSTQKGKIKITWSNISKKTTGYQIYRATSRYGTYSRIATIEDGNIARSYTNSGRTSGKTYYYKVRAYRTLDNGKKVYSSYSTVKYKRAK